MLNFLTLFRTMMRYWRMAQDPETPNFVRYLIYFGIFYTLMPFDILPDFIPGLGLLDDAVILPTVITLAMSMVPKQVKKKYDQKERIENRVQQANGQMQAGEAATQTQLAQSPKSLN